MYPPVTGASSPVFGGEGRYGRCLQRLGVLADRGHETPRREPKAKADKPEKEPAAKKPAKTRAAPKKSGKVKGAKKGKSARMASGASYGCGVCPETFPTQKKAVAHALTLTS